ncbi:MAG: hypothetical protein HDR80_05995 [Bacteroides sp.]|nr:hypothetical protein [Bacteroides sp.]
MKKIFTALSLVALMATSANAELTVKLNGETLKNNTVIELTEFEDFSEIFGYPCYEASANLLVDGSTPIECSAVTNNNLFQFCTAVCLDWTADGDLYKAGTTENSAPFMNMNHLSFEFEDDPTATLPATANDYMAITFKDAKGDEFKVTLQFNGNAGVEEIMAGDAEVVAVYDMQGRRVADDFKGLGIVLTSDGKAAKRIFK